jgi:predicted lipoprotein with Yx(FWY)xxD motif
MRYSLTHLSVIGIAACAGLSFSVQAAPAETARAVTSAVTSTVISPVIPAERERAGDVITPPGFHVVATELDGPVFADGEGRTLYTWPTAAMRNGVTGDAKNQSECTLEKRTTTAGLMSPYPPGLELPELDKRKSCAEVWAPEYAADGARPAGSFTVITRKDGRKQWAYNTQALYTSYLDKVEGDVMAASSHRDGGGGDGPAPRRVVTAPTLLPAGFSVVSAALGRQVVTDKGFSIYAFDRDGPLKSNCDGLCTRIWAPVLAPAVAQPVGDWTVFQRTGGERQWAYRKRPLYTYRLDADLHGQDGSDVPGWHNVYAQKAPPPPADFTTQDSIGGVVLADAKSPATRSIHPRSIASPSAAAAMWSAACATGPMWLPPPRPRA